jgi:hypothetical protein
MEKELNFDLKLPVAPPDSLDLALYREFKVLYNSLRLLADQVAGGNMLGWVDFSSASIIEGWSVFTTKQIQYRYLNLNTVLVNFVLIGTSNSTETSFTLPSTCVNYVACAAGVTGDNSLLSTNPGQIVCLENTDTVVLSRDITASNWTAAGTKSIAGQFIYRSS